MKERALTALDWCLVALVYYLWIPVAVARFVAARASTALEGWALRRLDSLGPMAGRSPTPVDGDVFRRIESAPGERLGDIVPGTKPVEERPDNVMSIRQEDVS